MNTRIELVGVVIAFVAAGTAMARIVSKGWVSSRAFAFAFLCGIFVAASAPRSGFLGSVPYALVTFASWTIAGRQQKEGKGAFAEKGARAVLAKVIAAGVSFAGIGCAVTGLASISLPDLRIAYAIFVGLAGGFGGMAWGFAVRPIP